ncbi:hypothetical protein Daus18300_004982 [Diaporthe australafricana]|uniref:Uncharacterized protein n=1 Tax=Diaporthe australafricana TaxID=127596 RepID=A0ABR3X4P2_9PEZI
MSRTWEIYRLPKAQVTEAAIAEPLIAGLKRAATKAQLRSPEARANKSFGLWYDMIEDGTAQLAKSQPLGVSEDLASVIRGTHSLWAASSTTNRTCCSARQVRSSAAGVAFPTICAIAYGRPSMGLPYVAYRAVDTIVMAIGALNPVEQSGSED